MRQFKVGDRVKVSGGIPGNYLHEQDRPRDLRNDKATIKHMCKDDKYGDFVVVFDDPALGSGWGVYAGQCVKLKKKPKAPKGKLYGRELFVSPDGLAEVKRRGRCDIEATDCINLIPRKFVRFIEAEDQS